LGADGWVCRKAHRDGQAAFGSGMDLEAGSVGFGDVGDDGQAETKPVRAGGPVRGGALEGLDQAADLVWRYGGSGVGHGKRRCCGAGCEVDGFSVIETALAAGQGDESIDELRLIFARVDGLLAGGSERVEVDVGVGQGYLEEGLAEHERGAQFVGGVGDEAPAQSVCDWHLVPIPPPAIATW
jgi:hypothetical protein